MNISTHQRRNGVVDQTMPSDEGETDKLRTADDHMKVPTLAGARVAGVQRTVVTNIEQVRVEG